RHQSLVGDERRRLGDNAPCIAMRASRCRGGVASGAQGGVEARLLHWALVRRRWVAGWSGKEKGLW
ncbi:hypothetical protein E2562_035878, partial [Oryza meyeriana var. granulata]